MNELARWDPFQAAPFGESVFDMIPTFFRPVSRGAAWQGPRMDVAETDTAYQLAIELPGIPKDAIQVGVYENSVTINAEAKNPNAEKQGGAPQDDEPQWLLRERSFGKFSRTLTLPEAVDDNASQARYADGVLYLSLQKKRASQTKRLAVH